MVEAKVAGRTIEQINIAKLAAIQAIEKGHSVESAISAGKMAATAFATHSNKQAALFAGTIAAEAKGAGKTEAIVEALALLPRLRLQLVHTRYCTIFCTRSRA